VVVRRYAEAPPLTAPICCPPSPLSLWAGLLPAITLALSEPEFESLTQAEPCLRPLRVAGTVPSAPTIGRSRFEASCEWVVPGYRPVRDWDLPASGHTEFLPQDV
jgi:hypothetical protein